MSGFCLFKSRGYILLADNDFWEKLIKCALEDKAEYKFLDFKKKLPEDNDRLKEHINAFGNLERGGCFVLGVESFVPIGFETNFDTAIQRIRNLASSTQEPSLNVEAFPLMVGGKKLLCLHILSGRAKPVFIKDRAPLGGNACYKRSGSSTIQMSIQEIRDLLAHGQEFYYDESPVKEATFDALDFKKLVELLPALDPEEHCTPKNIAILIDNRILIGTADSPQVTVAGWMCFAKEPQEIRQFRNAYIEFQIFRGIARDLPQLKVEIKGSLPEQIEKSIRVLEENMWYIPKIKDVPAYSEIALREVITNSLVHRDYKKMHQPVKISMFANRIEIENPGGLMPGLTVLNLIHKRDWRNPLLAELMKKFGFGEMDGQGIDRLYAATLEIKVPPPEFSDLEGVFTVTLSAPKKYEEFTPKEKRLMIVILAIMQEKLDNESIRNCFGISGEKAGTLIKSMVADKVLKSDTRSRKYAKYILTDDYREKIFGN